MSPLGQEPLTKQEKAIFATIIPGLILMIVACFLPSTALQTTYAIGALLFGVGLVAALLAISRQSRRDNGEQ